LATWVVLRAEHHCVIWIEELLRRMRLFQMVQYHTRMMTSLAAYDALTDRILTFHSRLMPCLISRRTIEVFEWP